MDHHEASYKTPQQRIVSYNDGCVNEGEGKWWGAGARDGEVTGDHSTPRANRLQGASTSTKTPQTNTAMPMRLVQTNNATVDRMFWWPKVGLIALGTQIHNDNNDISSSVGICGPGHTPYSTPGAHGSCPLSFCVAPDPPFVSIPNST